MFFPQPRAGGLAGENWAGVTDQGKLDDANLAAAGLMSIDAAANVLSVPTLYIRRLAVLGLLKVGTIPGNGSSVKSVVRPEDLQQYVAAGSPSLRPQCSTIGDWFADADFYAYERTKIVLANAAASQLPGDDEVRAAIGESNLSGALNDASISLSLPIGAAVKAKLADRSDPRGSLGALFVGQIWRNCTKLAIAKGGVAPPAASAITFIFSSAENFRKATTAGLDLAAKQAAISVQKTYVLAPPRLDSNAEAGGYGDSQPGNALWSPDQGARMDQYADRFRPTVPDPTRGAVPKTVVVIFTATVENILRFIDGEEARRLAF